MIEKYDLAIYKQKIDKYNNNVFTEKTYILFNKFITDIIIHQKYDIYQIAQNYCLLRYDVIPYLCELIKIDNGMHNPILDNYAILVDDLYEFHKELYRIWCQNI